MASEPTTLQEAILFYSDSDNCLRTMVARRWPNGVTCPTCGSADARFLANQKRWECKKGKHSKKQFSAKVGTIFEDSPIGLDKWLTATWMLSNCKNGASSWEIHRTLGVTQKTAWFMLHRIRLGMQDEQTGGKLSGQVEVDETFIGAAARNMHADVKARKLQGRRGGTQGKAIVAAVLERGGKVRAKVINRRNKKDLQALVREHVEPKSALYSDALKSYDGLSEDYTHQVIDHAVAYVDGQVHTNGMENFWSLLKRGLNGTYVSVEPYHLFRYVDEQAFRFNNRNGMNDADRFNAVLGQIVGKRLTYKELIGKPDATTQLN
jgi:transposase-like protein